MQGSYNHWLLAVMLIGLMSIALMMWGSSQREHLIWLIRRLPKCCPRSLNLERHFNAKGMAASSWSIVWRGL